MAVFPGRHSVYWEQVAGMGIPMICKYWEGTTHIDIGGNVIFLKDDSIESLEYSIKDVVNSPSKYHAMEKIAKSKKRKLFSYRNISRKAIEEK